MNFRTAIPKLIGARAWQAAFDLTRQLEMEGQYEVAGVAFHNEQNFVDAHLLNRKIRAGVAEDIARKRGTEALVILYWNTILFDAPYDFDCYCRYIEKDRAKERRFYEPRRKQLLPLVQALQRLENREIELLCISLPPGTGKTTLAIFFLTWTSGRHPELQNLTGSHNNEFLRGVYDECTRIFDPHGEYLFQDVFPGMSVARTNAKDMKIDLETAKRFATLSFASVSSGMSGKVRATNILYLDDLVEGIEQAMSKDQMDKLWAKYTVDYKQRKQGNFAAELHIATRWSLNDPIGRLEAMNENNPKAEFINIPALDEDGNSNFDYPYGLGFSTEMYADMEKTMDDASWKALFLGMPIEREGQLYAPTELRRYFELPEREPDAIFSVIDTKEQGDDYCAMPVVYQYGEDYYIDAWVCNNGKPDALQAKIATLIADRGIQLVRVESNRGGTLFAQEIQRLLKEKGSHCKITTKYNNTDKATRIYVASAWVKQHCLFWDESLYKTDKEYRSAMMMLTGYTMSGKNKHDDVPDVLADLENFVRSFGTTRVQLIRRPF